MERIPFFQYQISLCLLSGKPDLNYFQEINQRLSIRLKTCH